MKILFLIPLLLLIPLSSFAVTDESPFLKYPAQVTLQNATNTLFTVYQQRGDLQSAYPEVKQGNYLNLVNWAIGEPSSDSSYGILHPLLQSFVFMAASPNNLQNYPLNQNSLVKSHETINFGHQGLWDLSQGQDGQFRCWSYYNMGNYTIDNISGMVSFAKENEPNNTFEQSMTTIFLSKNNYQSEQLGYNHTSTFNPCKVNGVTVTNYSWLYSDSSAIWIGAFNLKLGAGQNSTNQYFTIPTNIVIPPHYYLIMQTDSGASGLNPSNIGMNDLEIQLYGYLN